MEFLRTPDEQFENLEGYAFAPNYVQVDDTEGGALRVHYLDEGPRDGRVVLLMHGQPVWSYLYRHMIPLLVEQGFRVVVPDLVGFGRSDKYVDEDMYSYGMQVDHMVHLVEQLELQDVTFQNQRDEALFSVVQAIGAIGSLLKEHLLK